MLNHNASVSVATVDAGRVTYNATVVVTASDLEGLVTFIVSDLVDLSGNVGLDKTTTDNASFVVVGERLVLLCWVCLVVWLLWIDIHVIDMNEHAPTHEMDRFDATQNHASYHHIQHHSSQRIACSCRTNHHRITSVCRKHSRCTHHQRGQHSRQFGGDLKSG